MDDRPENQAPFDERAALEELERLREEIERHRTHREAVEAEFDAFIKSFQKPREQPVIADVGNQAPEAAAPSAPVIAPMMPVTPHTPPVTPPPPVVTVTPGPREPVVEPVAPERREPFFEPVAPETTKPAFEAAVPPHVTAEHAHPEVFPPRPVLEPLQSQAARTTPVDAEPVAERAAVEPSRREDASPPPHLFTPLQEPAAFTPSVKTTAPEFQLTDLDETVLDQPVRSDVPQFPEQPIVPRDETARPPVVSWMPEPSIVDREELDAPAAAAPAYTETPPPLPVEAAPPPVRTPRRSRAPMLLGALVLLVGGGVVTWTLRNGDPQPTPRTEPAPTPAPPAAASQAPAPEPAPAVVEPSPYESELTTIRTAWVRVTADGERVIERELPADTRVPIKAQKTIVIRTGDAGAVRLSIGGQDRGFLGREGEVVTRTFAVPAATVR